MNWEAIGAVAELLGSFAVLLTLAYLAVQVRHSRDLLEENRKIALSQVHSERTSSRMSFNWAGINSDPLRQVLIKARTEFDGDLTERLGKLDSEETFLFSAHHANIMHHQDNNLYQNELGLLDSDTLKVTTATINFMMPYWNALGIGVAGRVQDWFEAHKDEA